MRHATRNSPSSAPWSPVGLDSTSMPDLRRQRRVVYHTKIRLRSPGREKSVVARVQNLSPGGVFVTATDLPAAGTEVLCRMLVAGERCTFKGLVAWVKPEGNEGAR